MGIREIYVAGKVLFINEAEDVYDLASGRVLTGSWVWDSAIVLSEWMSATRTQQQLGFDFKGTTVLELGAGTGLPGLMAAMLGSDRVILTDVESLLPGLRRNVQSNGLEDRVEVRKLVWGDDEIPSQPEEFDLVLASDVFFDAAEMAGLARTLKRVCGTRTVIWAASEVRPSMSECFTKLVDEGFRVDELTEVLGDGSDGGGDGDGAWAVFQLIPPGKEAEAESGRSDVWSPIGY